MFEGGGAKAHKTSDKRILKSSTYFTEGVFLRLSQAPRGAPIVYSMECWNSRILQGVQGGGKSLSYDI